MPEAALDRGAGRRGRRRERRRARRRVSSAARRTSRGACCCSGATARFAPQRSRGVRSPTRSRRTSAPSFFDAERRPATRPVRRERRQRVLGRGAGAAGPAVPERRARPASARRSDALPARGVERLARGRGRLRRRRRRRPVRRRARRCRGATAPIAQSMLLRNDGRGRFTDVTDAARAGARARRAWSPTPRGATWTATAALDLVVVGEWMPITVFRNAGGGRLARLAVPGARAERRLVEPHRRRRLHRRRARRLHRRQPRAQRAGCTRREREPATMYVKDFDGNGFARADRVDVPARARAIRSRCATT